VASAVAARAAEQAVVAMESAMEEVAGVYMTHLSIPAHCRSCCTQCHSIRPPRAHHKDACPGRCTRLLPGSMSPQPG
jgi:hypothetical protein